MRSTCGINKYKTGTSSQSKTVNMEFDKKMAEMQQQRASLDSMWSTQAQDPKYNLYEGSQDPKYNLYEGSQDPKYTSSDTIFSLQPQAKYTSPNVKHPLERPVSLGKDQYDVSPK
jgi:hypothetical protein